MYPRKILSQAALRQLKLALSSSFSGDMVLIEKASESQRLWEVDLSLLVVREAATTHERNKRLPGVQEEHFWRRNSDS